MGNEILLGLAELARTFLCPSCKYYHCHHMIECQQQMTANYQQIDDIRVQIRKGK